MKSYIIFWLALFVVSNLSAMVLGIDSKCQDPFVFTKKGCFPGGRVYYHFDIKTGQCAVIDDWLCPKSNWNRNVWESKEICEENCLPK